MSPLRLPRTVTIQLKLECDGIPGGEIMKSLKGQKAPAFSLEGHDGKNHTLDEYKGKTVVLFFYPKDSTPG